MFRRIIFLTTVTALLVSNTATAWVILPALQQSRHVALHATTPTTSSFIDSELRTAAMRLHTKQQAPKEGQAPAKPPTNPHETTHADYLNFLNDSLRIYQALEDIVNTYAELEPFRNTGMERTMALEKDVEYMVEKYNLEKPTESGKAGVLYADHLYKVVERSIPEFMCHYYNFYFAHTAGGRMIGKQMSAKLLDKHTLEFYKWDGDLNEIKDRVKQSIEDMAATWSETERQECIDATPDAFKYGSLTNKYLSGGKIEV